MPKLTIAQKKYKAEKIASSKITQLKFSMKLKRTRMIETSERKHTISVDKINNKLQKEEERKKKKIMERLDKEIKNLEREEKGHKKVVYKKKPR